MVRKDWWKGNREKRRGKGKEKKRGIEGPEALLSIPTLSDSKFLERKHNRTMILRMVLFSRLHPRPCTGVADGGVEMI